MLSVKKLGPYRIQDNFSYFFRSQAALENDLREYRNKPAILTVRVFDEARKSTKLIYQHVNFWDVSVQTKTIKMGEREERYNLITLGSQIDYKKEPTNGRQLGLTKCPIDEVQLSLKNTFRKYLHGSYAALRNHPDVEGVLVSIDDDYLGKVNLN